MSSVLAMVLALNVSPVEPPQWRLGRHDPVICFVWCYSDERDPVNIELARTQFHDNGWTFHEWVGSATVVPGQWKAELNGELHDVWFTQIGIHWGLRSPGPVNFVLKAGMFATWVHAEGELADITRPMARIEVGTGVAERLEATIGLGSDGLSAHMGWRF